MEKLSAMILKTNPINSFIIFMGYHDNLKTVFKFILLTALLQSCSNEAELKKENQSTGIIKSEKYSQETSDLEIKIRAKRITDSLISSVTKSALFDTAGLHTSPVKVIKSYLYQEEYSNYKNISLTYKNNSRRKIEAIKFRWYGEDAFGEPADMGSYGITEGFGGGFTDDALDVGKVRTSSWEILSSRAKKIILAWPIEVIFSDGIKWDIRNVKENLRSIDTTTGLKKNLILKH
jgi:hypothetical protein